MTPDRDVQQAGHHASQARAQFLLSLKAAQARLAPTALRNEAAEKVMDGVFAAAADTRRYVRAHPAQAIGLFMAVGAIVARAPLMALLQRLFVKGRDAYRTHRSSKD